MGEIETPVRRYPAYLRLLESGDMMLELQRQVGDLLLDKDGIAQRGLLVRHLVMPNDVAGTGKVLEFLAEEISRE